jgi:hypothetical protein
MGVPKQAKAWRERDLEQWFVATPVLPSGEKLVVVSHQKSIRTMVHILCLDQRGRLVLIEAKNERTTRAAIGQALEYLSVLQGPKGEAPTIEDLSVEAGTNVSESFLKTFGTAPPSPLPTDARVIVAAPDFLPSSTVITRWLNKRLEGVTVTMVRVHHDDAGFRLEEFVGHDFQRARQLKATGPAISDKGRVYCVLTTGPEPVVWHVGRPRENDTIGLPSQSALTKNALRVDGRRFLYREDTIEGLDLDLQGTVWRHTKRDYRATVLGRVLTGTRWKVVFCRDDGKGRVRLRARDAVRFRQDWEETSETAPAWDDLARRVRTS